MKYRGVISQWQARLLIFSCIVKKLEADNEILRQDCETVSQVSPVLMSISLFSPRLKKLKQGNWALLPRLPLSQHSHITWKEIIWYVAQHLTRRLHHSHGNVSSPRPSSASSPPSSPSPLVVAAKCNFTHKHVLLPFKFLLHFFSF